MTCKISTTKLNSHKDELQLTSKPSVTNISNFVPTTCYQEGMPETPVIGPGVPDIFAAAKSIKVTEFSYGTQVSHCTP